MSGHGRRLTRQRKIADAQSDVGRQRKLDRLRRELRVPEDHDVEQLPAAPAGAPRPAWRARRRVAKSEETDGRS
jgi:hypothetical protein